MGGLFKWRLKSLFKIGLLLYGIVLAASHLVRLSLPETFPYLEGQVLVEVQEMKGRQTLQETVQIAYLEFPATDPEAPVIVLLHGSPVASSSLLNIANALAGHFRVIVPDLPGFGGSTIKVKDYSVLAHAYYLDQLMEALEIDAFHLNGYSMGGGVAIDYVQAFPEKVKSLQLVSSIGVQELELLGDYLINHAIHGAQLAGLWLLQEGVPHFGWMDHSILNVAYARNFFDTDQRPFRQYLEAVEVPTLIIHAEDDGLVPVEAAYEHHRLIPQSELVMLEDGHMFMITRPDITAPPIIEFTNRVERSEARTRAQASADRLAQAQQEVGFGMRSVEGISLRYGP